jgi:hypothetical protein
MENVLGHIRSIGLRDAAGIVGELTWYTKYFYGLAAPLDPPRTPRPAKIPVVMQPTDAATFDGFEQELRLASGNDYMQLVLRQHLCRSGLGELYVAFGDDGTPIYSQWLIRPRDRAALDAHSPGRYAALADDEVLVEGAYTFSRYRRLGAMREGMAHLLRIAADEGMRKAFTYVEIQNVPSLRGCAEVGFVPDHMRASVRRLGTRRTAMKPLREADLALWERSTS